MNSFVHATTRGVLGLLCFGAGLLLLAKATEIQPTTGILFLVLCVILAFVIVGKMKEALWLN